MKNLKNYSLNETIYKQAPYVFYKASREESSESYIIKTIAISNDVNRSYYSNLLHEFALLQKIAPQSNYIVKITEFVENEELAGIVYKDENFIPLSSLFINQAIDINLFFIIAIQVINGLIELHKNDIIHKNISLDSIYFNSIEGSIQIHDFSIASQLKRTMVANEVINLLQGNLAYIAPEQTGRINRPLTQRADLYSLGVTFYHLLTGRLPFTNKNNNELLHELITTSPIPPHEVNPAIPQQLSLIIMKLLSKAAEDRYKSALGLHADLERAWIEFKDKHTISLFSLAQDDIAMRLELPDKLYGRDQELKILNDAFDSFCNTSENSLLVISGYSGTGKTSLIRELIEKVSRKNGLFVDGKFDKFERSDPYAALRMALNKIVAYQLSLPEQELAQFKLDLTTELGNILNVITDFIPKLQEIVGKMEKPLDIGIEQTKNRFEMAIQRFINVVSQYRPIVIFLDDLQWTNYNLFDLLSRILLSKQIHNIFLILSYRSNEVSHDSPIMRFIDSISTDKSPQTISIQGLASSAVIALLHDMFHIRKESIQPLAELLYKKTEGNPFFLLMLLEELYKDGKIFFSEQRNTWSWQEEDISSFSASDNVVEFVNHRLAKLPNDCKTILQCAACIGNHFSLQELNFATEKPYKELAQMIQPALQTGLIVPRKSSYEWFEGIRDDTLMRYEYYFQHDRIQQSCYHLLAKEEAEKQHLAIARSWYRHYPHQADPLRTMLITEQFNKGLPYVETNEEKELIRNLNYQSGEIAITSIAYEMAYHYDSFALSLLPTELSEENYTLIFNIYHNFIKSAFLSHHFKESEKNCEYILLIAKTDLDKAKILSLRGDLARTAGDSNAISYFEKALTMINYSVIAKKPSKFDLVKYIILFRIHLRHHALDTLSTNIDETQDFILSLITRLTQEIYYTGDLMRWLYAFLAWGVSTFPYQNQSLRALFVGIYCVIWPHSKFSHNLYQVITPIMEKSKNRNQVVPFYFAGTLLHLLWHKKFFNCIPAIKEAIKICEQTGDLEAISISYIYSILLPTDKNCSILAENMGKIKIIVADISYRNYLRCILFENYYRRLSGDIKEMAIGEEEILAIFKKTEYFLGNNNFYNLLASTIIHLEEHSRIKEVIRYLGDNLNLINRSNSTMIVLPAHLYLYLLLSEDYSNVGIIEKIKYRLLLIKIMRRFRSWSTLCPENFSHCLLLLKGEWAGLNNRFETALDYYEQAAKQALEHSMIEYTALVYHRALLLCIRKNDSEKISLYLQKSIHAYEKWGAFNVVKRLQEQYSQYE